MNINNYNYNEKKTYKFEWENQDPHLSNPFSSVLLMNTPAKKKTKNTFSVKQNVMK